MKGDIAYCTICKNQFVMKSRVHKVCSQPCRDIANEAIRNKYSPEYTTDGYMIHPDVLIALQRHKRIG